MWAYTLSAPQSTIMGIHFIRSSKYYHGHPVNQIGHDQTIISMAKSTRCNPLTDHSHIHPVSMPYGVLEDTSNLIHYVVLYQVTHIDRASKNLTHVPHSWMRN